MQSGLALVCSEGDFDTVFAIRRTTVSAVREDWPNQEAWLVRKQLDADQATMLLAEIKSAPVDVIESEERLLDRRWVCAGV